MLVHFQCDRTYYLNKMSRSQGTVLNDPVHGTIKLDQLCMKIINTPEFQRLRNIKQLGAVYYVYPGACHNRFEHSLGVCYLAGKLARKLKDPEGDIVIDDKDILCVEIAGLCHDLGHGPFSHLFDKVFTGVKKHEQLSVEMFDHLIKNLRKAGKVTDDDLSEDDVQFIKELIDIDTAKISSRKSKEFLYEIVANKRTGIDVDKWDYFARDCHYLGIGKNFDHLRLMEFVRLIQTSDSDEDEEKLHICYREKEALSLYDMYYTRYMLHERAYQHKVVKIIDEMICDAFRKAADVQLIDYIDERGQEKLCTLCEAPNDMTAYATLTDSIFEKILYSTNPKLVSAREILQRIHKRELYQPVAMIRAKQGAKIIDIETTAEDTKLAKVEKMEQKKKEIKSEIAKDTGIKDPEKLKIIILDINYGKGDSDPIKAVKLFYNKDEPESAFSCSADQVSAVLPQSFSQQIVYICCTNKEIDGKSCQLLLNNIKEKWEKQHHVTSLVKGKQMAHNETEVRQSSTGVCCYIKEEQTE